MSMCCSVSFVFCVFFFFNDTATTEIYTLSLHDALPISLKHGVPHVHECGGHARCSRSEEHTSELQSHVNLVCRLLLEKKKNTHKNNSPAQSPNPPESTWTNRLST